MSRLCAGLALAALPALWVGAWLGWLLATGVERLGLPGYGACLAVAWLGTVGAWAADRLRLSPGRGAAASVASVLVLVAALAWWDSVDLAARGPANAASTLLVLAVVVAGLWGQGARAFLARQSGQAVRRALGIGVLALASLAVVARWTVPVSLGPAVIGGFLAGCLAMALVQLADVGWDLTGGQPDLGGHWLVLVAVTAGLAGLVATLVTVVLVPGALLALGTLVGHVPASAYRFLVDGLVAALTPVFALFEQIALWLTATLLRAPWPPREPQQDLAELAARQAAAARPQQPWVGLVCGVVVLGVALALLLRWLAGAIRRYNDRRGGAAATALRESMFSWSRLAADARSWAVAMGTGLAGWRAGAVPVMGVRALYVRLLALGAARGRPRALACTPDEYLPTAAGLVPGRAADVAALTEAYVAARYGGQEPDPEALAALMAALRRVEGARGG